LVIHFGSGKQIITKNKRSESRSSQLSKRPRNAPKSKKGWQEQICSCQYPKSIVSEMLKRIKRVKKGYWGLVALLMISSWNSEPSALLYLTWAIVAGYLIWKIKVEK